MNEDVMFMVRAIFFFKRFLKHSPHIEKEADDGRIVVLCQYCGSIKAHDHMSDCLYRQISDFVIDFDTE